MLKQTLILSTMLLATPAFAGVTGSVSLKGTAPAAKPIDMASDPKCKTLNPKATTDDTLVNGGKVQNVLVYIKNAPAGTYTAKGNATIDQKGCMYTPKVVGVMVKQKLDIINSDPTLLNVHALAKRGEFNQAMPKQGQKITKDFKKAEMVPVKCDVHGWMHATVGVFEHPFFAVTDDKGAFTIDATGLADGEYDLAFWHETLGEQTAKVKVAGGNGTADFTYSK
jgi:hypothetical protein